MKRLDEILRSESGHWVGDGFPVRSLFSYHALKSLRRNPSQTYAELMDEIREPIRQHYPSQHPNLRGNLSRRTNEFLY